MVERKLEKREEVESGEIVVCKAIHEWSNPASHSGHKYIYVYDTMTGKDFMTQCSLEEIVNWLNRNTFSIKMISDKGERRQISHQAPISGFTVYADGYFGRPLIPASYYSLHPFDQEQIDEFNTAISNLEE